MGNRYKRTSKIWFVPTDELADIVKNSFSIADICRKLDFAIEGKNYNTIRARLIKDNIDFSHILLGNKGRKSPNKGVPLKNVLVKNSNYCKRTLKRRLIKDNFLKNECYGDGCDNVGEWLGKPLILQLDHINGDRMDDRITNLRLLCPNCHTQTKTWGRKDRSRSSNG